MTLSIALIYATAFAVTFFLTMLRGFQNKSVAGGHKKLAFLGGGAMTALENTVTIMLAHQLGDYFIVAFTSAGSSFGWVAGMYMHDQMMRKRLKAAKKAKKTKRRTQIEEMVNEQVEERLKELGVI
jgi:hypothetical protein